MRYVKYFFGITFVVVTSFQTFGKDDKPTMRIVVISSEDLPSEFDSARTYHYASLCTNPESLLTELWNADVRVWRAWLPLDNQCMGPIGPLFTVEIRGEDSAILDFDFSSGEGRLHCATRLKRFVIED